MIKLCIIIITCFPFCYPFYFFSVSFILMNTCPVFSISCGTFMRTFKWVLKLLVPFFFTFFYSMMHFPPLLLVVLSLFLVLHVNMNQIIIFGIYISYLFFSCFILYLLTTGMYTFSKKGYLVYIIFSKLDLRRTCYHSSFPHYLVLILHVQACSNVMQHYSFCIIQNLRLSVTSCQVL